MHATQVNSSIVTCRCRLLDYMQHQVLVLFCFLSAWDRREQIAFSQTKRRICSTRVLFCFVWFCFLSACKRREDSACSQTKRHFYRLLVFMGCPWLHDMMLSKVVDFPGVNWLCRPCNTPCICPPHLKHNAERPRRQPPPPPPGENHSIWCEEEINCRWGLTSDRISIYN